MTLRHENTQTYIAPFLNRSLLPVIDPFKRICFCSASCRYLKGSLFGDSEYLVTCSNSRHWTACVCLCMCDSWPVRHVCVCVCVCVRCTWIMSRNDEPKRFTSRDQEQMVANVVEPMASDGLRTICLAFKDYVPGERWPVTQWPVTQWPVTRPVSSSLCPL